MDLNYPRELPITARKDEIVAALRAERRRVVIISGETGCGKSTQIPKMCLEAGRGAAGMVGVTQPRRLAAVTIAHRIAEELGEPLGRTVGYKIRFQDRSSRANLIKVMTDGMLLAETQGDRLLRDYGTIIIDEAHERSLNIDFLLGIVRRLIDERRDLKLVVTSATLDTEKFSQAFRNAPVIEVSGRMYPVHVEYRPPEREEAEDKDYVGQAVEAVAGIKRGRGEGDVLVFMPTEQDILETCRLLEGRKFPMTAVLPLFSRLPAGQQRMVYTVSGPKIVVATNVAETSLTIPGIRYVVDTGVARIARYQPGTRIKSLPISPISRASADQRKGRSGRVREGVCVRLYSEADYEGRDEFTPPEILRSDLAEVILRMIDLGLGDPLAFPFIDRPSAKAVRDGYDTLVELGAIITKRGTGIMSPILTEKGRAMARMPLDPRISRMLLEARAENCLAEAAVLAAVLSIRDPRERPPDKSAQADAVHEGFRHPDSDFIGLLNIWNRYHGDFEKLGTAAQKRKFCHENFLSFPRMREWVYLHDEILSVLSEQRLSAARQRPARRGQISTIHKLNEWRFDPLLERLHDQVSPALYGAVHRSILAGFLSNIACLKEKNVYTAAKNREVTLWPGSALFKKSAGWIVATEMVKTSRLFARTAARIDPAWLERLGGALCKRSYSDAAWDRGRGETTAKERVTLFGLEIVRDRRVSYGRVNPAEAHGIFVMSGLVEGGVDDPPVFLLHNLALQKRIEALEEKLRRRDLMVPAARIAKFYSERLPGIHSVATLRKFLKDRGGDDAFLRLDEETLTNCKPGEDVVSAFPDTVEVAGRPFRAVYKFAPGEEDDGVTLNVPVSELPAIPVERLEWGVPGQYEDKIAALIKGLPKRYRKLLVPVAEKAATIAAEMERAPEEVPLAKAVAEFVRRRFGVDIPAREWALADVPRYLRMRLAVVDPATGRTIDAGRDVELLRKKVGAADMAPSKVESPAWREACRKWERSGIEGWTFGDLPEKVAVGTSLTAYPALKMGDMIPITQFPGGPPAGPAKSAGAAPGERRGAVSIKLFATRAEAVASHRKGVRHLLMAKFGKELAFVRRYHKIPAEFESAALPFGGREAVERMIEEALARETFERPIRTEAEFRAYEVEVGRTLFDKGHILTQTVLKILGLRQAVRAALSKYSRSLNLRELDRLKERAVPEYLEQIGRDVERLVPANFLEIYPVDRLVRIPRYLEGLKIRLERARVDPEKDRAKSAQVEPYAFELARLEAGPRRSGTGIVSPNLEEKAAAVDELRWMIEEFKLALFAPEIRTAHPISAVRLARKIKEIDALV